MKQILTPCTGQIALYVYIVYVLKGGQSKIEGFRGSNYWIITMSVLPLLCHKLVPREQERYRILVCSISLIVL